MATKTLITEYDQTPAQICFQHSADFSPTPARDLRQSAGVTLVELDMTNLADGTAQQSAQFDLGAIWAEKYLIRANFEFQSAATVGDLMQVYFGWSQSSTIANGWPGNLTGSDAAYSGYATATLGESVKHLDGPYNFVCVDDFSTVIQSGILGIVYPPHRYGVCVIRNESNAPLLTADAAEQHIVLDPIIPEFQDV